MFSCPRRGQAFPHRYLWTWHTMLLAQSRIASMVLETMICEHLSCNPLTLAMRVWSWKPWLVTTSRAILSLLHCEDGPGNHDLLTLLVQSSHFWIASNYGPGNHDLLTPLVQFSHSCAASMVLETKICVQLSHSCIASMVLETMIYWHLSCNSLTLALRVRSWKPWFVSTSRAILALLHCKYVSGTHDLLTHLVQFSHSCIASMVLKTMIC